MRAVPFSVLPVLAVLTALFLPAPAVAVPIGVGDVVRGDFDVSGFSATGPYDVMRMSIQLGDGSGSSSQPLSDLFDPADVIQVDFYDAPGVLVGQRQLGPNLFSVLSDLLFVGVPLFSPALADGVGFFRITGVQGAIELRLVLISGETATSAAGFREATLSVPEPTTSLLLAAGLAGLGVRIRARTGSRRRRTAGDVNRPGFAGGFIPREDGAMAGRNTDSQEVRPPTARSWSSHGWKSSSCRSST